MANPGDDEVTKAMCIRCGQLFSCRARCPYCADLVVSVRQSAVLMGAWRCTITRAGQVLVDVAGFSSATEARQHAHHQMRRLTRERLVSQQQRCCSVGPQGLRQL